MRIAVCRFANQRLLLSLCCSHTPYDGGNVCFPFQWSIQQMSCEKKNAAKAISRAPRAFGVFELFARGVMLYTWIIIVEFWCYSTCDFMYKFSWEYSVYWGFYPNFISGRLELLDSIYLVLRRLFLYFVRGGDLSVSMWVPRYPEHAAVCRSVNGVLTRVCFSLTPRMAVSMRKNQD